MDGNTLPTLNSHIFKIVMCPTCKKYPSRHGRRLTPRIIFTGFRWNVEQHILEIQGHCDFCFKEWRLKINDFSLIMNDIDIGDPKLGPISELIPVEQLLRRCS